MTAGAADGFKGFEIVLSRQVAGGLLHSGYIQRLSDMPGIRTSNGKRRVTVDDMVTIGFAFHIKPGVKSGIDLSAGFDDDTRW
jgi:hypothetical protein